MTSTQWKQVEEKLKDFYSTVKLNCDGYQVAIKLERIDQFKNGIMVYISGIFQYKWLMEDCEERRRFCRPIHKSLYSQKSKAQLKKITKKQRKEIGIDLDKSYTYYANYWTSFRSLKNHLTRNNENIELIEAGS